MKTRRMSTLAAGAALSLACVEAAIARPKIPVLLQITNNTTGTVGEPKLRMQDGDTIVFSSDGDVTGPSPGHHEVYVWDLATKTNTRLTTTVDGESRENSREGDSSGAGDRPRAIAFISTGDLDPGVGNADHNPEVFLWIRPTNQFVQLTNTTGVVNSEPYAGDSFKCVVFTSTGNLDNNPGTEWNMPQTGYTNVDGSQEVFIYSIKDGENFPMDGHFTQISNGPAGTSSHSPVVGGYIFQRQCQTTAYVSDYDQLNKGMTGNNIYVFDRHAARTELMESPAETPWTIQPGDYTHPAISAASPFARGPFVVFQTTADEWRNDSTGNEIFRFRAFHPRMEQYTDYLNGEFERPAVTDGGGFIAFQSNGEVLDINRSARLGGDPPFNADGNYEIFRMKGRFKAWQITNSSGCTNEMVSMRDDPTSMAFRSNCDLIPGENPNGLQQIFLYREVFRDDPLSTSAGCLVSNGCCNEANGCYQPIYGAKPKPRKKGCIDSPNGCDELLQ